MKKLIVLSVVFALVAAAAFAADLGVNVFTNVTPFQGESGDTAVSDDVTGGGGFGRVRIGGSGEAGDGKFGAWFRTDGMNDGGTGGAAYAFWKPIDQLKILMGGNPDGFYGKEGVTGWGFQGNPYDGGVGFGGGNIWGGGNLSNAKTRDAFFGGYGSNALHLNITPMDILTINIAIPFIDMNGNKTEDIFKKTFAQLDLNLDFGNIALSYQNASGDGTDQSEVFAYFGGAFGDLGLDVGLHYKFANKDPSSDNPIGIGLGLKYATDAFGVKFRTVATLAGEDKATNFNAEVMPYFPLGDNLVAFVAVGIGMSIPDEGDSITNWYFNPYLRIGEEWGAQFLVGLQVWSDGGSDGKICWGVPIGIMVSF